LETAQLNRVVNNVNQIDRLAGMGLFEMAPTKPYVARWLLPMRYPGSWLARLPARRSTSEQRSYLHRELRFLPPTARAFSFMTCASMSHARSQRLQCRSDPSAGGDVGVTGALTLIGDPTSRRFGFG